MKLPFAFLMSFLILMLTTCSGSPEDSAKTTEESIIRPAASATSTCADQAKLFLEPSLKITARWLDARTSAEYSSPQSLDGPIKELQALRTEWGKLEIPTCTTYAKLGEAKLAMNKHMSGVIDGYSLRRKGESASTISAKFDEASNWLDNYVSIMNEVLK